MLRILLILASATALFAQPRRTIFLVTDAEGVGGICRQDQTDAKDPELKALLTGEINAAVDGFYAGGADDVVVWDGHDGSQTLSTLTIHPRARLLMGYPGVLMTLDQHYAAIAFVGQHARADSKGGVMAHSYSSLGIETILVNGKPFGEIESLAALAGAFHTPVIFLSGDQAAADDVHAVSPEAELAVVKQGLANYACLSLSAPAAQSLIRDRARLAMKKISESKPYKIEGPVTVQIEYTARHVPGPDARNQPGVEFIDARTLRFHGKDFIEAWTRARSR
ncbi:MAG TPA: M55 family metallopeptidase [Bryobacteraceae bacterium]|nr:M55 family metallopeptidase [Bryobacteraceae bacterium]